jgi:hypothetical protein
MSEHILYTVRQRERMWAVLKDKRLIAVFSDRDAAVAHALGLMEERCAWSQSSTIIIEGGDGPSSAPPGALLN